MGIDPNEFLPEPEKIAIPVSLRFASFFPLDFLMLQARKKAVKEQSDEEVTCPMNPARARWVPEERPSDTASCRLPHSFDSVLRPRQPPGQHAPPGPAS